jgi:hypothetical protein
VPIKLVSRMFTNLTIPSSNTLTVGVTNFVLLAARSRDSALTQRLEVIHFKDIDLKGQRF